MAVGLAINGCSCCFNDSICWPQQLHEILYTHERHSAWCRTENESLQGL